MIEDIITQNRQDFRYWFKYVDTRCWHIFDPASEHKEDFIGILYEGIEEDTNSVSLILPGYKEEDILDSFKEFTSRPEYSVYNICINNNTNKIDLYDKLLVGCILIRMDRTSDDWFRDPENFKIKLDNMLKWIHNTDFYSTPASTRFHGAYREGLLEHTLIVAQKAIELSNIPTFKFKVNIEDAVLIALVHDWCKIGLYESYLKNIKNPDTGIWEQKEAYKVADNPMSCYGHGVSSLILAQKFFKLSTEEALAIRWHMGEYNVADNEMNDLHQANETYPLVQLIQFADRLSIVKY